MNAPPRDFTELGRLIAEACDGRLSAEEMALLDEQLRSDAEARQFYLRYIALDVDLEWTLGEGDGRDAQVTAAKLLEVDAAEGASSDPSARRESRLPSAGKQRRLWLWISAGATLAIASAAVLLVALSWNRGGDGAGGPAQNPKEEIAKNEVPAKAPFARVVELDGVLRVTLADKQSRVLAMGDVLEPGQVIAGGALESAAELALADDSRIRLTGITRIALPLQSADAGVSLRLEAGTIHCEVKHQPDEKPLVIEAPQASIRVVGTRFSLSTVPTSFTRIDMDEGRVELTCRVSHETVVVEGGHYCVVGAGDPRVAVQAFPNLISQASGEWRREYAELLAFSPASDTLVAASRSRVAGWHLASDEKKMYVETAKQSPTAPSMASDRKLLATSAADGRVEVRETNKWQVLATLETKTESLTRIAVGPVEAQRVATAERIEEGLWKIVVWKMDGLKEHSLTVNAEPVLAWSPDGEQLVVGLPRPGTSRLIEFTQGTVNSMPLKGTWGVRTATFSPDGRFLATGDPEQNVLVVTDTASGAVRNTVELPCPVGAVVFSPDSLWVCGALDDGHLRVWRATTGAEAVTVSLGGRRAASLAFSSSGTTLAASVPGVGVRLFNLTGALRLPSDNTPSPSDVRPGAK